ncbi:FliI/YscN family ATPase [Aquabacterium sp. A7-Y]|uniref:FliI/YscN family ATPase n=1 Tax=Aquabacterium sp. A7-Y TaxID=1349605 RepID=UPI0039FCA4BC
MSRYLADALDGALSTVAPVQVRGRVRHAGGTLVRATGVSARIGDLCELVNPGDPWRLRAEVVGIADEELVLAPLGELTGLSARTEVSSLGRPLMLRVGPQLLGRVLDGLGQPADGLGPIAGQAEVPVQAPAPDPLKRRPVARAWRTGVRAIDALLTCGEGQRVGIFAPAGAGKSSLLSMIARGCACDVIVVGLIGERGREVGEFIGQLLTPAQRERTVCVVATSDRPAGERATAPCTVTAIAEYFRDQGQNVLLLLDSVTRYARALREIGLANGEPPTRRGYTPSVFSALPRLFERAGQGERGAITAFYTVLVDDDATGDPVAEEVRATLDGHILLSAELAEASHFPAIDVLASRSRVMRHVTTPAHRDLADLARSLLSKYKAIDMLLKMGEYRSGSDSLADRAVRCHEPLQRFLRQDLGSAGGSLEDTLRQLRAGVGA